VHGAASKNVAEAVLSRRPGVFEVDANPVAQTATVTYDPSRTSVAVLAGWVRDCGYHCAGQSVPEHICDPLAEPAPTTDHPDRREASHHTHHDHVSSHHQMITEAPVEEVMETPAPHADHAAHAPMTPQEAMGHGGHHAAMSMDAMVRDMRNRFLVAALLSIPILLWSPIGREVIGFTVPAPFGLRDDVFSLILSLPVIFYSSWIFFDGAWRALRARTLDMMVLVAVVIGAGWLYSVYVTLTGGGEVFYEAATVLAAFVLLGHWFEMHARGVFPTTKEQRCWWHKSGNTLAALPKSAQPAARAALAEIYNAEDKTHARAAAKTFAAEFGVKWPKAAAKITDDLDVLLAFYDYPAEHWIHPRTTNPIESTFATVRLRTRVTKGPGSRAAGVAMAFKLIEAAQTRWRMVNAPHLVALVRAGALFVNGKLAERHNDQDQQGGRQAA
jgi:copper chaperone CopZ